MTSFRDELKTLGTAEDFLSYFGIDFVQRVVDINRLHILQRFHDYLAQESDLEALDDDACRDCHRRLIARAYRDFVESDSIAEKVFKVHQVQANRFVPLTMLRPSRDTVPGAAGTGP